MTDRIFRKAAQAAYHVTYHGLGIAYSLALVLTPMALLFMVVK